MPWSLCRPNIPGKQQNGVISYSGNAIFRDWNIGIEQNFLLTIIDRKEEKMAPKYSNSMLKDPSIRAKIQKELSELELEMKIMNFNQEKHFCFLSHEDFSDHIFCSGKCIEKGYMEATA